MRLVEKVFGKVPQSHIIPVEVARLAKQRVHVTGSHSEAAGITVGVRLFAAPLRKEGRTLELGFSKCPMAWYQCREKILSQGQIYLSEGEGATVPSLHWEAIFLLHLM